MLKNLLKGEKGQALVEMAIALPIILSIIMATFELGWMYSNQLMLTNIAREGVRSGITYTSSGDNAAKIKQRVRDFAPDYAKDKIIVSVTYSDLSDFRRGDVIVKAEYNVKALTPLVGIITGESYLLKSTCKMKMS